MAGPNPTDDYVRGSQEISEQVSTWHLFLALSKWGSLVIGAALLFMVLWFQPGGSFFGGLISAVVMLVVGYFALRSKPSSH